MKLQTIITQIQLEVLTESRDFSAIHVESGYCSDMLSCVMTGAKHGSLWVTLLAHSNIVAVASLLEIPAIIITESAQPDPDTLARANERGIVFLSSPKQTYEIAGLLWEAGLR